MVAGSVDGRGRNRVAGAVGIRKTVGWVRYAGVEDIQVCVTDAILFPNGRAGLTEPCSR
jgi:hypothetical protein